MRLAICLIAVIFLLSSNPAYAAISFTISNPQQQGDEVTIDVSLSRLTSSSCNEGSCYLQAAFTQPSPIRYFGFTKNQSGEWYEYISSPDLSYMHSTFFSFQPIDGSWSGQLTLKVNYESSNYKGPGQYNIKAWRYSGKSTNPSGNTDTLSIDIEGPPTPTPTSTPTSTPTPTPTQKITSTPTKAPTSTTTPKPTSSTKDYSKSIVSAKDSADQKLQNDTAFVAGTKSENISSDSANTEVKGQQSSVNYLNIFGAILVLSGISSIVFIYLRSKWST